MFKRGFPIDVVIGDHNRDRWTFGLAAPAATSQTAASFSAAISPSGKTARETGEAAPLHRRRLLRRSDWRQLSLISL